MASTTINLTSSWQSLGSGKKTITCHGSWARFAFDTSTPGATVVGHTLRYGENVSLDAESDNVYVMGEGKLSYS